MKKSHILIFTFVIFYFAILQENVQAWGFREFATLQENVQAWAAREIPSNLRVGVMKIKSYLVDYRDKLANKMKIDTQVKDFYKQMRDMFPDESFRQDFIDPIIRDT